MRASFGDEEIQKILLLGYRFCSWFSSNIGRRWYAMIPVSHLTFICLTSFSIHPSSPEHNVVHLPPSGSTLPTTTPLTYLLPLASCSLTTIHIKSSAEIRLRTYLDPIPIFSASSALENGNAGSRAETSIADIYFWRYPLWINDFSEHVFICFYLLIRWGGLFQMRLGTIDNRAHSRCLH